MNPEIILKINYFIIILFLITIHEAAHAWMAEKCGDPTGRMMGRITINPLPHLDPIGTVLIPAIMIFTAPSFAIIGWGKPCPVNPANYKDYKRGDILVSIAGPAANLIASFLALVMIKISLTTGIGSPGTLKLLYAMSIMGFGLCVFNLIPLPPLDGSHIIRHILPPKLMEKYVSVEKYSLIILLIFINTPLFSYFFEKAMWFFKLMFYVIIQ